MKTKNISRQVLQDIRNSAETVGLTEKAKMRLLWFLFALDHGGDVSAACKEFRIAPSTFHRWWHRFDPAHPASLEDRSRRPHRTRKPETPEPVIAWVRHYRILHPTLGKNGIAKILREQHGITVSASTVGRVIARCQLFFAETPAHQKKRGGDFSVSLSSYSIVPGDDPVPTANQLHFEF